MDATTKKTFQLLEEVILLCEEQGIPYYLGLMEMRCALTTHTLPDGLAELELLVPDAYFDRLEQLLEEKLPPERALESLKNNPNFVHRELKYVRTDTTYIDYLYRRKIKLPGFALRIVRIVPGPTRERKARRSFWMRYYTMMLLNRMDCGATVVNKKRFLYLCAMRVVRTILGKRLLEILLNLLTHPAKAPERVALLAQRYMNKRFFESNFVGVQMAMLEGKQFCAPEAAEELLTRYYSEKWKTEEVPAVTPSKRVLQLDDVAFDIFSPISAKKAKKLASNFRAFDLIRRRIKKRQAYINRRKLFYTRAIKRFELYDYYLPIKKECLQSLENGDIDRLDEFLKPYWDVADLFYRKNIPFAFDKDFYKALIKLSVEKGEEHWKFAVWLINRKAAAFRYLDKVEKGKVSSAGK